jgi:hypothetical protein
MIFLIGLIVAAVAVVIFIKRLGNRGVTGRGYTPVKMCGHPRCKLPETQCRHRTRQAEIARGMHQKH